MKFIVMVKADAKTESGALPDEKILTEMGQFNEELAKAGLMLSGDGLHPSSRGARVRFSGTERKVIDGPFAETKELIAGFWMWRAKSLEEAIEWAKRSPNPTGEEGELEIRQVYESEELGEGLTPELREREARLRAELAGRGGVEPSIYLLFNGQCEEAFRFYAQYLGGKIEAMMPHAGSPAEPHVPAEWKDKILHARMNLNGRVLMASDAPPSRYQKPQGFSVSLGTGDAAEAERVFQALADGGTVVMPFGETFWAHRFGMVTDRFGIPWMVNCEKTA